MALFTDNIIRDLLSKSLKTASADDESVKKDIKRIKSDPLLPKDIPFTDLHMM